MSPAAKESPQPYESTGGPGSSAGAHLPDSPPRRSRGPQRGEVAGGQVDGVYALELLPRQLGVIAVRLQAGSERGDRSLAPLVDERHRPARGSVPGSCPHLHSQLVEAGPTSAPGLVLAQRREEQRPVPQPRELHGCHGSTPGGLLEGGVRVHHVARSRNVVDTGELDPLDVANHGYPGPAPVHGRKSHILL